MAHPKPIGEQMAALNTSDDTSFAADRSNGVLNATCPARIQNTSFGRNNVSLNESTASSSGGKWLKPKREALKITPLAQIDENPPVTRKYVAPREKRSDYKTRLCDAFRRHGYCPYNNNCTYAHGDHELQMPVMRRPLMEYSGRDSSRQNRRDSRERRGERRGDSRSRRGGDERDGETSFSRRGEDRRGDRYHRDDQNWRPSSSSSRQICHAFQRGNCRFGPRCRYIHQEQMQQFNANATMFAAPPSSDSIAFYHHNTTQTYMMPYFIAPPSSQAPPPQFMQPCDLNQSIPVYLSAPPSHQMGTTYYCAPPPMSQTPVMDQSMMMMDQSMMMMDQSMMMGPATTTTVFPDFSLPPPQLMS
ncbi:CRE-PIE-1 protein [Caenorhabditis remanei]|uniref:CRE-PIE-1 protein n=1 Tax=Caenorhabditis remanei TaxID=31234 RepID=E3N310_CAERE|nr:CRE-PIE-1 protein [Caenorhabditis remanei]